jgi:hypothetical protein
MGGSRTRSGSVLRVGRVVRVPGVRLPTSALAMVLAVTLVDAALGSPAGCD